MKNNILTTILFSLALGFFLSTPLNVEASVPLLPNQAASYFVYDFTADKSLAEQAIHTMRPIASLTKLMTAVVAREAIPENGIITMSQSAYNTLGQWGNIKLGERFYRDDALHPLLLSSDNDIAVAFTEYPLSPSFITQMNTKAKEIGMSSTQYVEGSGLSPQNISTVSDYMLLLEYVDTYHPEIFNISRIATSTLTSVTGTPYTFYNNSGLKALPDRIGGKSGLTTPAGRTMATLFSFKADDGTDHRIGIVTFKSLTHDEGDDTKVLLNFVKKQFLMRMQLKKAILMRESLLKEDL